MIGLALLSLVLMFVDSRFDYLQQVRYYASIGVTPVHLMADLPSRMADIFSGFFQARDQLEDENAQLKEQLLMLQYDLQKLGHLEAENKRLNELLKASSIVDDVVVRAQLIGESADPFVKRVLINKGSKDGAFIRQPVIDAYGLLGQVVEVELLTSRVLLITDPLHATPVQVNRNGVRAIASGTADGLNQLTLDNMPNTADIVVGDVLVTSGLGQSFPAGYPVGVVTSVVPDPGQPFAHVLVTPTAQLDRSRNVLLVFPTEEPAVLPPALQQDAAAQGTSVQVPSTEAAPTEQQPMQTQPTTEQSAVEAPAAETPAPQAVPDQTSAEQSATGQATTEQGAQ